jgi:hypothetical protein
VFGTPIRRNILGQDCTLPELSSVLMAGFVPAIILLANCTVKHFSLLQLSYNHGCKNVKAQDPAIYHLV